MTEFSITQDFSGIRLFQVPAVNIGPNLFHRNRTVSWRTSIQLWHSEYSTFRSDSVSRMNSMTAKRMISGDVLK